MTLAELRSRLPDYAKDLRLNLESVLTDTGAPGLTPQQLAMVAVASAIASRHAPLTESVVDWARGTLDDRSLDGARAAAAIMAMTNVYYRFTHLVAEREYETMRTGLRMNVLATHGSDKAGFELASLAVSAINGCGKCIDSHEKTVRGHGVGAQGVQSAIRIAATIHAVAVALEQADAAAGASSAAAAA
ncbi:MAG TPA: carboxymuconolactone decarboxylase family protein [Candidatus Saccharimonadia bacterium]|nr:carboxymuconolactone decarboxylase family protein [Candidatus Saccharimonadia bacterium]